MMEKQSAFLRSLKIVALLSTIGMYISGIGILIMTFMITIEIIGRYLFGFSMLVVDEWSGYLLVIVTFLGLAYTMRTQGFLQIGFLINRFSENQKKVFDIVLILIALFYSILIDYKLIVYTWTSYITGVVSTSISQTALYIPQLFMPLGMTLLVFELLVEGAQSLYELIVSNASHQEAGSSNIK